MARHLCVIAVLLLVGIQASDAKTRDHTSSSRHHRVRGISHNTARRLQGKGPTSSDTVDVSILSSGDHTSLPKGIPPPPPKGDATSFPSEDNVGESTGAPSTAMSSNPPVASPSAAPPTSPVASPTTNSPTLAENPSNPLSPTDIDEEQSRTRALLPFSLELDTEIRIDDVDQVMEMYLFNRLAQTFDNLDWILLAVSTDERRMTRRLQTQAFDFTGDAVFQVADDTLPTEQEVQKAQLEALQDFQFLNEYINEQGFDWLVDTVILDGMEINKDGMVIGDTEINNDGDSLVIASSSQQASANNGATISLSLVACFLVLGAAAFLVRRNRMNKSDQDVDGENKNYAAIVSESSVEGDLACRDVSYDTVTQVTVSFDSVNLSGSQFHPSSSTTMDWNRVFALSQIPVEQTMQEVFEAKKIKPPRVQKTQEIVTLAPVQELPSESQFQEAIQGGDGDSYGYDSFPGDGVDESFVVSSPVTSRHPADYAGDDRDITIDLSDFVAMPQNGESEDDEW